MGEAHLENNQLTSFTLPDGLDNLQVLDLLGNQLTSLRIPIGFNLIDLDLKGFSKSRVTFYKIHNKLYSTLDHETKEFVLSWSSPIDTFVLESSSDFSEWKTVEGNPEILDGNFEIKLPISENQQFFRLVSQ